MVTVQISDTLAEKLARIAERDQLSLDTVVENFLERHVEDSNQPAPPGTLAALLQAADEADLYSGYTDAADRSREILHTEYGEYLRRKHGLASHLV